MLPAPEAYLLVVYPATQRRVYSIQARGVTVGRASASSQAEVAIETPSQAMSRRHARILRGASSWQLVDQGSRNGSHVNGRTFTAGQLAPLTDGAVVRLGEALAVFRESRPGDFDAPRGDDWASFPGVSPAAVAVRQRLRHLATLSGHALIVGETGTGKERASRAIAGGAAMGATGRRPKAPAARAAPEPGRAFVVVNCAELARSTARAELFGYAQGAFTGATSNKAGLVEQAAGGVLFLDEVGELPWDVQGELLRFLEDGSYRPIGGDARASTARVVAATNVNLDDAVRERKFRQDLLARLRAHNPTVELAPLRERREDILGWAEYFVEEEGAKGPGEGLCTAGAAECLLLYHWPDNLRGLRGTMRALSQRAGPWPLKPADLPKPLQAHRNGLRERADGPEPPPVALGRAEEPTRAEIEAALRQANGVMRAAAEALGVERKKLYRLCERRDIDFERYRVAPEPENT